MPRLSFANPWAAGLVPLLVVLAALVGLGVRRYWALLRAFGEEAILAPHSRLDRPTARVFRALLLTLAVGGIVAAIARPVLGPLFSAAPARPSPPAIGILLDVSRSMAAEDYAPQRSRLAQAQAMLLDVLPTLAGARVGVVTFAREPLVQAPLTDDHTAVGYVLRHWVAIESAPGGGSDLPAGLRAATRLLTDAERPRVVVVLSDGGTARADELRTAVAEARAEDIRILALGLGGPLASRVPTYDGSGTFRGWHTLGGRIATTRLDDTALRHLATGSGGAYVHVVSGRELRQTVTRFLDLGGGPGTGERRELFQGPLAASLLLLALERLVARRSVA